MNCQNWLSACRNCIRTDEERNEAQAFLLQIREAPPRSCKYGLVVTVLSRSSGVTHKK
jgi:hypothetical protein